MNNRFSHKGIGNPGGVYTCESCGRKTRDTGRGEASTRLCACCYEIAEQYNCYQDDVITLDEFKQIRARIKKQYHREQNEEKA